MIEPLSSPPLRGRTAKLAKIEQAVGPVLRAHGVSLFDLSLQRERGGWVLRVVIDADHGTGGVSVDLCADISRDLSTALDVSDPIEHAYMLEVSSPGLERPLRGEADFERFHGKTAKVTLSHPLPDGARVAVGVLAGVNNGILRLQGDGPTVEVPIERIKRSHLVFDLPAQPKKKSKTDRKRRPSTGR